MANANCLCARVIISTSLYGAAVREEKRTAKKRKVNFPEMDEAFEKYGRSVTNRVRNEEVCRRAGIERELATRVDQSVLRWFGHVEKMDEYRIPRRVWMAEVTGRRVRGRPRFGWMDGVKMAFGSGRTTVVAARQINRKEWRALVHMSMIDFHVAIFAWLPCLSDRPSVLWGLAPGERWGACT